MGLLSKNFFAKKTSEEINKNPDQEGVVEETSQPQQFSEEQLKWAVKEAASSVKRQEEPLPKKTASKSKSKITKAAANPLKKAETKAKEPAAVQVEKSPESTTVQSNEPTASLPPEPVLSKEEDKVIPHNYQISTFYSQDIKKIYKDGVWYFALEDILLLVHIDSPNVFISKLKEKTEAKKVFAKDSRQIELVDNDETKQVDCITYEGFMALLPLIRTTDNIFLGPFPDWLKSVSEIPYEEVQMSL